MGLTNDLRDIMREANILDEMEAEKMEQENLEALESISGSAGEVFEPGNLEALKIMEGSMSENSRQKAADVDVDVESVWTPHQLIQVSLILLLQLKFNVHIMFLSSPLTETPYLNSFFRTWTLVRNGGGVQIQLRGNVIQGRATVVAQCYQSDFRCDNWNWTENDTYL